MNNSKHTAKQAANKGRSAVATAESLTSQVSGKISDVVDAVREAPGQAVDYVRDQYDHLTERAQDAYGSARDTVVEYYDDFEDSIQRRPIRAVLIAGGIGILVGTLMTRR